MSTRWWRRRPRGPVTIADGHHRYETALRYRDERRMSRSCEEDPAFDYLLMLFLDQGSEPLTVLPTHRIVRGLGDAGVARLVSGLPSLFEVEPDVARERLAATFEAAALTGGGEGRFGLWTRDGRLPADGQAGGVRTVPADRRAMRSGDLMSRCSGVALERLADIDAAAVTVGRDRLHEVGRRGAGSRSMPVGTVPTRRSCSSRPRSARSRPLRPTATSCPRNRPTSIRRP